MSPARYFVDMKLSNSCIVWLISIKRKRFLLFIGAFCGKIIVVSEVCDTAIKGILFEKRLKIGSEGFPRTVI